MDTVTKSLLSKYYGFGSERHSNKSFANRTEMGSLEISLDEGEVSSRKHDEETLENRTINDHQDDEDSTSNLNTKNLATDQKGRLSRVLDEETLIKGDTMNDNYEMFLEKNATMNNYIFKDEKPDDESFAINEIQLKPPEETSDTNLGILEETISEVRSNISSPMLKKRTSKKFKTSIMSLPPPPRKIPIFNGTYLDLTSAKISLFPLNMLDELSSLKMLYLENNNLTELPNELFPSLRLLQWLDVRNNQLTSLPSNIAGHPSLETLLLQGNRIEKLPLELCQVSKLKGLQTMHNPLVFPPKDVVSRGCTAILAYLREEWQKIYLQEVVKSKGYLNEEDEEHDICIPVFMTQDHFLDQVEPDLILCYKPKSILKKKKKSINQFREIASFESASSDTNTDEKIVRQKSSEYKPSNRCTSEGISALSTVQLMWISKVKEMLGKQALALQRMKDKEALSNWRKNKSSYNKSIAKAAKRTADDIPFAVDLDNIRMISKQYSKLKFKKNKRGKHGLICPVNINHKMEEVFESLNQLQLVHQSQLLSPRTEQKLLEVEIRKISDLQDEIQNLKYYNDILVAPLAEA